MIPSKAQARPIIDALLEIPNVTTEEAEQAVNAMAHRHLPNNFPRYEDAVAWAIDELPKEKRPQ